MSKALASPSFNDRGQKQISTPLTAAEYQGFLDTWKGLDIVVTSAVNLNGAEYMKDELRNYKKNYAQGLELDLTVISSDLKTGLLNSAADFARLVVQDLEGEKYGFQREQTFRDRADAGKFKRKTKTVMAVTYPPYTVFYTERASTSQLLIEIISCVRSEIDKIEEKILDGQSDAGLDKKYGDLNDIICLIKQVGNKVLGLSEQEIKSFMSVSDTSEFEKIWAKRGWCFVKKAERAHPPKSPPGPGPITVKE
jgi:hypothetical protein